MRIDYRDTNLRPGEVSELQPGGQRGIAEQAEKAFRRFAIERRVTRKKNFGAGWKGGAWVIVRYV